LWHLLSAGAVFGFAAGPVGREYRFSFHLLGGFLARLLQLLRGTGLLFGSLMTRPLQFLRSADLLFDPQWFRLGCGLVGRLTFLTRLFLGFSCGNPEIAAATTACRSARRLAASSGLAAAVR